MKKWKSISIISLVLAIVALIFAGMSFFDKTEENNQKNKENFYMVSDTTGIRIRVGYVNFDTIMTNCKIVDELLTHIETRSKEMDTDLESQKEQFEKDVNYFQTSMENGSLSEQSAQEIYANVMSKEQEIYALQEKYAQEIQALNIQSNAEVYAQVISFLQRYNENYKYFDYILNYSMTNPALLDANYAFDITPIVVDSLNKLYDEAAKKKNKK